jgi:predicted ABC-type ATPase
MPVLTVIAGPNGSGKSTLMRKLEFEGRQNLLNPDDVAVELSPSSPERAAFAAGRQVIERTREYLQAGMSFAIETTLSSKQNLATLRLAKDSGFQVRLIYIALDAPEHNLRRVKERVASGGHNVPDEDVRRRYYRSLANAPEALRIAHEAVVYDNSGLRHEKVLELRGGSVTWHIDQKPKWVAGLYVALRRI